MGHDDHCRRIAVFGGLADKLVKAFSAKGLVPDDIAARPEFLAAVAIGAAITVFAATLTGFPISTTHALTGALIGAGVVRVGADVNFARLGVTFFLPLVVSPVLAVGLGASAFAALRRLRSHPALHKDYCLCVEERALVPLTLHASLATVDGPASLGAPSVSNFSLGNVNACNTHRGPTFTLRPSRVVNALHFVSSGAVSFARGLNDAPKIVGLLVVLQAIRLQISLTLIALVMALGGVLHARKVAETVSHRITAMSAGEGLIANLITSLLVLSASHSGLPVSTTHVSCASIFGMGLVNGKADKTVIRQILMSWILTLPLAALLASIAVIVLG